MYIVPKTESKVKKYNRNTVIYLQSYRLNIYCIINQKIVLIEKTNKTFVKKYSDKWSKPKLKEMSNIADFYNAKLLTNEYQLQYILNDKIKEEKKKYVYRHVGD